MFTNSYGYSGPKAYAAALASHGLYAAGNEPTQLGSLVLSWPYCTVGGTLHIIIIIIIFITRAAAGDIFISISLDRRVCAVGPIAGMSVPRIPPLTSMARLYRVFSGC